MGGPLSVAFSDMCMVKMENDVVISSKNLSFIADLQMTFIADENQETMICLTN